MGDRRENWLDPGGGQGKNKIPGAPGDPTVDAGQGTVRLLRQFCRILARIIHEDTPFVNNAPAGAGSAAPAGFDPAAGAGRKASPERRPANAGRSRSPEGG